MVSFAIFLSLFVSKARTATTVGFAIFLVGVIVQGAATLIFSPDTDSRLQTALKFLPFTLLAKGMGDLGTQAAGGGAGLRWADRDQYGYFPLSEQYNWLIIDWIVYLVVALLYDFLFGGVHGESRVRRWVTALR